MVHEQTKIDKTMGMYTELIFGCSLKEDTPNEVIERLDRMINDPDFFSDFNFIFRGGSYYFGVNKPVSSLRKDYISGQWVISTRSNIKNYNNEIERFLYWIKPYIDQGSGYRDMYAIVTDEEAEEPTIYYLT